MNPIYRFKIIDIEFVDGKYLIASTGISGINTSMSFTKEYISVTPGQILKLSYADANAACFYDSSKKHLSGISVTPSQINYETTVPAGAYYLRVNVLLSQRENDTAYININGNNVIEFYHATPIYKDDAAKTYNLENGQKFFRIVFDSALTFVKNDYDFLMSKDFDETIRILIEKSIDNRLTWKTYITGKFVRTDCKIDEDNKKITVNLDSLDEYTEIMTGLEKEYNLIKLAPAKTELEIQKRPLIQLYIPGDKVVSCFLGGNYWEQDTAFEVTDTNQLINTYYFALGSTFQKILITGSGTPIDCRGEYTAEGNGDTLSKNGNYKIVRNEYETYEIFTVVAHGKTSSDLGSRWKSNSNNNVWQLVQIVNSTKLRFRQYLHQNQLILDSPMTHIAGATSTGAITYTSVAKSINTFALFLYRISDNTVMFISKTDYSSTTISGNISFKNINGTGVLDGYKTNIEVYMRYLLDVEQISDLQTYELPIDDIVEDNRAYSRAIGYAIDQCTMISTSVVEPTEYGLTDEGKYFTPPYSIFGDKFFPIARSTWGLSSLWFNFNLNDSIFEQQGRKSFIFKETMLLSDVIKVLLKEVSPELLHDGTEEYSQFLYGVNPITYTQLRLMITQKSNLLIGEIDQPAQKAPITLSSILNMLKNTCKCYWYIEYNKFKIEHILFFRNGGTYSNSLEYNVDLRTLLNARNNKSYDFEINKYEYEKMELPERIECKWMDDVTLGVEGYPIQIKSKYVQLGKVDKISISDFTTDIDYMLLNPGAISKDGFGLFAAYLDNSNLFDLEATDIELGKYLNTTTGATTVNASFNTSGFIKIDQLYQYSFNNSYVFLVWYNKDKQYISGTNVNINNSLTQKSPVNAAYLRMSTTVANWSALKIVKGRSLSGIYKLPFLQRTVDGADMSIQNGALSFIYLHPNYWTFDLPGKNVNINNEDLPSYLVRGVEKKKKQTIKYPSIEDPDPYKLIKTSIGDGQIETMSVNMQSGTNKITLKYDTE